MLLYLCCPFFLSEHNHTYRFIKSKLNEQYQKQAEVYQKIVDVLKEKSKSGVVTLNLWDLSIRTKKGKVGAFHSIYDKNFQPNPAYKVIRNALIN